MLRCLQLAGVLVIAVGMTGCKGTTVTNDPSTTENEKTVVSNRIDIPGPVRTNLGITFTKVEQRSISNTLRVPGRFELLPTARVEFHTPMQGRVELAIQQFQLVNKGDLLFRLDSPDWRSLQRELSDNIAAIDLAEAQIHAIGPVREAHQRHEQGLKQNLIVWTNRKARLEELGTAVGNQAQQLTEAQSRLADTSSSLGELMEKAAELEVQRVETESRLRSSKARLELLLTSAVALTGIPLEKLVANDKTKSEPTPLWKSMTLIEFRTTIDGVIEQIAATNGSWLEQGALVISVADPSKVRFRAKGPQSDLDRLRTGLLAAIVNPAAKGSRANEAISTTLELGLNADPEDRTVDLFATPTELKDWTRAGVSAFLEIALEQTDDQTLAIPMSAVVRDGLTSVIFRRDPANPDKAIRIEADLGANDGRWIVINSGVREGDEIVLDGVYQLLLATSGSIPKGGHFHADGTFHEGEDH